LSVRGSEATAATPKSLAVVGAGWAGLAAAVRATEAGYRVTVFEMAPRPGGRARSIERDGLELDNGQHILIGAYRETLALMRTVGADPDTLLDRRPLALVDAQGRGLVLPAGPALSAFVRAVLALDWPASQRLALLAAALRWRLRGFRAEPTQTVADLARSLPLRARATLIEPLCVAALNTPAERASAQVFLRVLRDALFGGPGAADLLLPRVPLSQLVPGPAARWLQARGAELRTTMRVQHLEATGDGHWQVDGRAFDAVVLACSAAEAARLAGTAAPAWAQAAAALVYEPIVTVYLRSAGSRLPAPMVALDTDADAPAQFAFDLGALDARRAGVFALVISGARAWVDAGLEATGQAALRQARAAFGASVWHQVPQLVHTIAERRATFACTPGSCRPPASVAAGLAAAGDYVDGPYPATLEGAVRSAGLALRALKLSKA
jgi:squalene-associated FAD-dependent desaturase